MSWLRTSVDDVRGCTRTGIKAYYCYTTLIGTGSYVEGRVVRAWLWFGPRQGPSMVTLPVQPWVCTVPIRARCSSSHFPLGYGSVHETTRPRELDLTEESTRLVKLS